MDISLIGSVLIAVGVAWYLLKPHLAPAVSYNNRSSNDSALVLHDQKDRVIQVLKDLELDYATGKVSLEDYERTKASLELEAAEVLGKLDAIKTK